MPNYAAEWKKETNLHQISYDDFVSLDLQGTINIEKVDGMLGVLNYKAGKDPFFQTTTEKGIHSIPVTAEYKYLLNSLNIKEALIVGELVAERNRTILPFNKTQSIVKTFYQQQNADLIFHYPFDIISLNGKKVAFKQAIAFVKRHFSSRSLMHIRTPKIVYGGLDEFRKLFKEVYEKPGFDGIVIRNPGGKNYKVKFTNTVDLVIVGAGHVDLPSWPREQVSYLLSSFIDKDGIYRSSSKIGTGMTNHQRGLLYKFIIDNKLYEKAGEFLIKPKMVVEMKYFRVRLTDTPAYKFEKGIYKEIGMKPSMTFSHPSFERIRGDKKPNRMDTRLEQVPEWGL